MESKCFLCQSIKLNSIINTDVMIYFIIFIMIYYIIIFCYFFIICLPAKANPSPTSPPRATAAPPATAIPTIPSFSSLLVTIASNSCKIETVSLQESNFGTDSWPVPVCFQVPLVAKLSHTSGLWHILSILYFQLRGNTNNLSCWTHLCSEQ